MLGGIVVLRRKGTRSHRRIGLAYAAALLLVNATALAIYDLYGRFGPFHVLALVSLATLAAGFLPAFVRRPAGVWVGRHARSMCWSYVGLVAAFVSEIAVRLPGARFAPAVISATLLVVVIGDAVVRIRVPRLVARWQGPRAA